MTRRPWLNGLLRRNNFQEGNKKTLRVRKLTSGNPDELLCWQNNHRTLLVPETVFIQLNINLDLDFHDPYPVNFRSSLNCVITLLCNVSPVCKAHSLGTRLRLHRPTTIPHTLTMPWQLGTTRTFQRDGQRGTDLVVIRGDTVWREADKVFDN